MANPTRREIRDSAMKLLFEKSLRDDPIESLYEIAEEIDEIIVNDAVRELVDGTLAHLGELDETIQRFSKKRSISRISKLNLTILRLAMFEILYDDGTPTNAAVSEAILLAETYTASEDDIRFINGLLGAYTKELAAQNGTAS
ncbi:MAG: transcription antitermination factor NusB [Oscillospiraceae bacterium]|nr:transcription antitermination factor NusB [Oscillospiraceae bacterium]